MSRLERREGLHLLTTPTGLQESKGRSRFDLRNIDPKQAAVHILYAVSAFSSIISIDQSVETYKINESIAKASVVLARTRATSELSSERRKETVKAVQTLENSQALSVTASILWFVTAVVSAAAAGSPEKTSKPNIRRPAPRRGR